MKKLIITIAAVALSISAALAQDAQTTEMFNNAVAALQAGDKAGALDQFKAVLPLAEALGADGEAVVENCKKTIPAVILSMAKDAFKDADYDTAIAKCQEAAAVGKEYGVSDVVEEAEGLVPQFRMQKGNALLNAKDFAGASEVYKEALAADPTDGVTALRLGQALSGAGKTDEAVEALKTAAANGQEATANKLLSNIFTKKAAAALKAKDFKSAAAAAAESNDYLENANACKIAGISNMNMKNNAEAVKYLKKYLELAPTAADAAQMKAAVEALSKQQ